MKELTGATKEFVGEGLPLDDACDVRTEVMNVTGDGLVVTDDWRSRDVGVMVIVAEVEGVVWVESASASHDSHSNSSSSSWGDGNPDTMVSTMARRIQRYVMFLEYMIASLT